MQKITFYGWRVGMQKVAFSLLLRDEAGLGLKEAHESTTRVLDEEPVTRGCWPKLRRWASSAA
jgi:hypothetical protein